MTQTGNYTVSLRDEIAHRLCELRDDHWWLGRHLYQSEADAILALVRGHLTSDKAVERALAAWVTEPTPGNVHKPFSAAILAALGDTE